MFHLPCVLLNLFSVTRNGSEKQYFKVLCPWKHHGQPSDMYPTIYKLSYRGAPPLLCREPSWRTLMALGQGGLNKAVVRSNSKNLSGPPRGRITLFPHSLLQVGTAFRDKCSVGAGGATQPAWSYDPRMCQKASSVITAPGRQRAGSQVGSLLKPGSDLCPRPGLVTEPCLLAPGWEEPSSRAQRSKEADTDKHLGRYPRKQWLRGLLKLRLQTCVFRTRGGGP